MTPDNFDARVAVYCAIVAGSETSGRRTLIRNVLVGGVMFSPHRFRLGRDVELDQGLTNDERRIVEERYPGLTSSVHWLNDAERTEMARRLGLRLIVEHDHDHLQPLDWEAG